MEKTRVSSRKVLLLSSRYGGNTSANGICVKNIAEELEKRGYIVFVITSSGSNKNEMHENGNIHIYALKQAFYSNLTDWYNKKKSPFRKIVFLFASLMRKVYNLLLYPNVSPIRASKCFQLAKKLINDESIDMVISTYRPYESIYTAIKLKKKYRENLKIIDYQLDVLTEPNQKNNTIRKLLKEKAYRVFANELITLDKVIMPESYRNADEKNDKILYSGFPVYIPSKSIPSRSLYSFDINYRNIVYIGTLNIENRSPKVALSVLESLNAILDKKFNVHFWGVIDQKTRSIIESSKISVYHGLAEQKDVINILSSADYILNISNEVTYNMLPSKIFQEFASKKPIINFVKNIKDCSRRYFEQYGCTIELIESNLLEPHEIKDQIEEIEAVRRIPNVEMLVKYTPQYFVDMLEGI